MGSYNMDDTKYTDRDGYVWDKHCETCDRLERYSQRKDDTTTCLAFGVSLLQEPVRSYHEAGYKNNNCPNYRGS